MSTSDTSACAPPKVRLDGVRKRENSNVGSAERVEPASSSQRVLMADSFDRRGFLVATALPAAAFLARRLPSQAQIKRERSTPIAPPNDVFVTSLPRLMEIAGVPGIGMIVVQDGRTPWEHYAGVMDAGTREPVATNTLWPAASLSKPVFAFAALRLADDGKLDLDRPLKTYVPDHAPNDERGDRITARHVLSHSSGLRNWRNQPGDRLVPDFEPGARFQYSGEGYYYLLRAVEHITGMGFEQFMQQRLLGPLGMSSSTYAWRADVAARVVTGHDRGRTATVYWRDLGSRLLSVAEQSGRPLASFTSEDVAAAMARMTPAPTILPNFMIPNSAATLITTPRDYGVFMTQLLTGSLPAVAPRAESRRLMFTSHTPINSALSWGLGLGQEKHAEQSYGWHWGDNGSWKNFMLVDPATRSGVALFTNGSRGLNLAARVMTAATGSDHEAFLWL